MAALCMRAAMASLAPRTVAVAAPFLAPISAQLSMPVASFATMRKPMARKRQRADDSGYHKNPPADSPMLKTVLRQFQMKIHPDFFGQFPEMQQQNSDNFQTLMSVLNDAKSGEKDDYMQLGTHKLEFIVRTDKDGHFLRVPLLLEVKGGQSKHVIGRALSRAFNHVGLPTTWQWGKEYWNHRVFIKEASAQEEE